MAFLGFLLSLFEGIVGLFMKRSKSTAENLGVAEEKSSEEGMTIDVLEEEAKAAANAPTDKQSLQDTLSKGSL